ncbi:glycoside hydrolase family 38 N-terminal domain-containing protein [Cohnella rhizosphaerae]|uniref:Glycoside hydrolase family 38 central domain-containing protein n=1 Tax=Cohnella rhizosphaerae TaxID=1457232 RepID=A0A9X4L134_9BACL|nr:hypothetical protein [Cohnella rhizosphaerae]MDG0814595.1 hypothetical protein [Cohnella rhizosphaerae]
MSVTIEQRLRRLLGPEPKSYWEEKITERYGYWGGRILAQLFFAYELSKVNGGQYDQVISKALTPIENGLAEEGVIGKQTAIAAEALLQNLAAEAKSYEILAVAHAHIDMNWMWSWDETVAVTLDTFRTMLNLMEEYPAFTFSQSQASIYRIVEQYAPDMLLEIKRRVKEGRWEVTASHWVEADKNMPNGESLSRHLLYAKRYLADLFELDIDSLNLDFEPDTFGHSLNVPEILANGGVKYFYHCRGNDAPIFYKWEAPSGKSVLVYREPTWYNDNIQSSLGAYVPDICRQTGLKTYLKVYGVGDHGGGPTRRDLERLQDMNDWPIYPRLRFGTYREFFAMADAIADRFPVMRGEQNFIFTGCYTSQTRIKTANRMGEAALNEAEAISALANVETGKAYPAEAFEEAWRNVLFNQFHDILPGSGVIETREHALGLFQNTMATANTHRKLAMERIAADIDTSGLAGDSSGQTTSEGGGSRLRRAVVPDYPGGEGGAAPPESYICSTRPCKSGRKRLKSCYGIGKARLPRSRSRTARAMPCRTRCSIKDLTSIGDTILSGLWRWSRHRRSVTPLIPSRKGKQRSVLCRRPSRGSTSRKRSCSENELLQAMFDSRDGTVRSLIRKDTGEQLVDPARPAGVFRLIQEDPERAMTAWRVGRYMEVTNLHGGAVKIKKRRMGTAAANHTSGIQIQPDAASCLCIARQ